MSGFLEQVAADNRRVFLHLDAFAETRTVLYDGECYADIPVVLSGIKEKDRRQLMSDHGEGLFLATAVLHCAQDDLGGCQPEKGQRLRIRDADGGFYREFYVASSVCETGMLRVELEAITE